MGTRIELRNEVYQALVAEVARQVRQVQPASSAASPAEGRGEPLATGFDPEKLGRYLTHTQLSADATQTDIERLCEEADQYGLASVCVNPGWLALAAARLRNTPVLVTTVIGFPLGASTTAAKRAEADECLRLGADELSVVLNLGLLKSGLDDRAYNDVKAAADLAHTAGAGMTVLVDTARLDEDALARACRLAATAGADFVEVVTGLATNPASGSSATDLARVRKHLDPGVGLKAGGDIRHYNQALSLLRAGATRLSTSASLDILSQAATPR